MGTHAKATPTEPDLSQSFQRLAESATRLNKASDDLSRAVAPIEVVLKKLNLGISKWYTFEEGDSSDGSFYSTQIGYDKVGGKWCLAIAERSGHFNLPEDISSTEWAFSDAPRQLRIRAVKEIPNLLEALIKEAEDVANALESEAARAKEVAETLTVLSSASGTRR